MKYFSEEDREQFRSIKLKKFSNLKILLFVFGGIVTLGIMWVLCYYIERLQDFFYNDTDQIEDTDFILFTSNEGVRTYCKLRKVEGRKNPYKMKKTYYIVNINLNKFYFSVKKRMFVNTKNHFYQYLLDNKKHLDVFKLGVDKSTIKDVIAFNGPNQMRSHIKLAAIFVLEQFFRADNFYQFTTGLGLLIANQPIFTVFTCIILIVIIGTNTL